MKQNTTLNFKTNFQELSPEQLNNITGGGWIDDIKKIINLDKLNFLRL
ncbi:hypothetical protein SaSA201_1666 [Streptococcus agalactiae]|nr:hypothetical protein SaSA30_1666 [Streptococcus agalactiae]EPU04866.1 hypothetical protein SAG0123_05735 [Streptococcus agalactiae STIR-CD-13]EPU06003.1 hypothetical protein SAG0122_08335 [Streptococcus agalactiae STIR-CD-09]EPW88438.1 hypothetical protein SAG0121_08700 [Streptococcus agalactiae STIR-CD-07]CCQ75969.1 hypothetical protein GBS1219_1603 [Streptococcus agalactiae SS1219]CCQ78761.1 hypothetical protein GBS90503_1603 [Streptococcus agalactiae LADL-90-503]